MDNPKNPKKVYKAENPEDYDRRMFFGDGEKQRKERYEKLSPEQKERVDRYVNNQKQEAENGAAGKSKWLLFGRAKPY